VATIDMGRKEGGGCYAPFVEAVTLSNKIWPGPRPTSMPSAILIHPAVFATIDMGQKLGAPPPFWGGGWVPIYLDLDTYIKQ